MKDWLKYFFIFVVIIFVIPVLFTKSNISNINEEVEEIGEKENSGASSIEKYDYGKYSTIKLYHNNTGSIEEIPFDEYLYGTVSAEMPANFELEALKAQAVVSRTYTLHKILNNSKKHGDADICDDYTCCQAWISKDDRFAKWKDEEKESNWNKIVEAVNSTSGKVIIYDGNPINAFFHSNSGGVTETVSNVWGGTDLPYLQSVETSGETEYSQYSSEASFSKSQLVNLMKEKYSDVDFNWDDKDAEGNQNVIKVLEYTDSRKS